MADENRQCPGPVLPLTARRRPSAVAREVVAAYADWRRTAYAVGPDDSAPLDAVS